MISRTRYTLTEVAETFVFDADDNKFVVTVKSTGEEIYRSHFDEDAILSAIKSVVGDQDNRLSKCQSVQPRRKKTGGSAFLVSFA